MQVMIGSTSLLGYELDTRPQEMGFTTLDTLVQRCPECGYCASNLDESSNNATRVISTAEYKTQLHNPVFCKLAKSFFCKAIIDEANNDLSAATWSLIHVAWACDDEGQAEQASECRRKAAAMFKRAELAGQEVAKQDGVNLVILADLLRRSGQMGEVIAIVKRKISRVGKKRIRRLLEFEMKLAQGGDRSYFTVDEALGKKAILSGIVVATYDKNGRDIIRKGCRKTIKSIFPSIVDILACDKKGKVVYSFK